MKNTGVINVYSIAVIVLIAGFVTLDSTNLLASKRLYEVKMDKVSINGPKVVNSLEYKENASLSVSCGYSYLKPYFCDAKEYDQWFVGFYVDGKKMGSKAGIWPARTSSLGKKRGGPPCITKFMTSFKWTAQKGPHVIRCVLNENRKITGDKANNNQLERKLMVRKASVTLGKKAQIKTKKQAEPQESILDHSHLVVKSGTKKKK